LHIRFAQHGLTEMAKSDGRPRVLFVSQMRTSFINDDLALLSERYDVRSFEFGDDGSGEATRQAGRLAGWFIKQAAGSERRCPKQRSCTAGSQTTT
jgi:hypothetical protein